MMRVGLALLATVALSFAAHSNAAPMFIMSAPNPLRVGSAESIYVEAQDYAGANIAVTIRLFNFPTKGTEIHRTNLVLHTANKFRELKEITIPTNSLDRSGKQFLYLQALFTISGERQGTLLEKVVLLSFKTGYIFIQTDKTLYTPKEKVRYRIFTLGPGMTPVTAPIRVELKTPGGITVEKEQYRPPNGLMPATFKLTEPVSFGNWKVVAKFQSDQHGDTEYSATFEVKEYVLPSFEVTLSFSKPYFHVDTVELPVDIEARYLFDKPVTGTAIVVVGVIGNNRISLPESLQRVKVVDGRGTAVIRKSHIIQKFSDINTLVHKSLYVTVSVLTDTGSDMVTTERVIPIVSSPYKIDLKKTPLYFKPGLSFECTVYVTHTDGSPVEGVLVEAEAEALSQREEGTTQANGVAKIHINTKQQLPSLYITVRTKDPNLKENEQATQSRTIRPYLTKGNSMNYLHIGIAFQTEKQLLIHFRLGKSPAVSVSKQITYLILSKGRIIRSDKIVWDEQETFALNLMMTKDMLPSFRFVAYYHVGETEVVSDSVWVDVKDSCMGQLSVTSKATGKPGDPITFVITGDPGAKVGLVAVDKGVYALNNKHRLTQPKIWDVVENQDIGCTTGSGKDSMGVFYDAGLVFAFKSPGAQGNADGTPEKTVVSCPVRSRRSPAVTITDVKTTLVSKYSTDLERECCMDGMRKNILDYTCERRSTYINDGPVCIKAFLRCCTELSSQQEEARVGELTLARSEYRDDEDETEIKPRTYFPESWLWYDVTLPSCSGTQCDKEFGEKRGHLPGSITSWQITAISLSETLGICVADPHTVVVSKKFFVDLKLPYSVVTNEQIEIKAIIHNYLENTLQVRVTLIETTHVCSAATKKHKHRFTVSVASMSTRSVPFVIIPMEEGEHDITVTVVGYDSDGDSVGRDGITKKLRVVSEGVLKTIQIKNVELYPSRHGGSQRESIVIPKLDDMMPNTEARVHISVTGEQLARTIAGAISGEPLGKLIRVPYGCGEQNMVSMTFPLIATHYLDETNQWDKVGVERRSQAIDYIKIGYTQQLAYQKKSDGSFVTFLPTEKRIGSTWKGHIFVNMSYALPQPETQRSKTQTCDVIRLTAYVVKVFAMAENFIYIETEVMCKAAEFLVQRQKSNGVFQELAQMYDPSMMGEINNDDKDSTLTAFVLIAMQQLPQACMRSGLRASMNKAQQFLEGRIHTLSTPYSVAITSYALANVGRLNYDILFRKSTSDRTHWDVGNNYSTLEATSYALLALLKAGTIEAGSSGTIDAGAIEEARPISSWLSKQGFIGGGYASSTQANIMVFHAIAEFMVQSKKKKIDNIDLNVDIVVQGRSDFINMSFNQHNYYHTRSNKVMLNEISTVFATGIGHASLLVNLEYFAMPEEKSEECNNFTLNIELTKDDMVSSNRPFETYKLVITFRFKGERKAGMTILDIGMLTGFEVDQNDLKQLSTGKERYIQRFEMDDILSTKGSLIIYLSEVSHNDTDKIVLRMYNEQEMNLTKLIQPAAVTIYEYYVKEHRCVKFYHPVKDGTLAKLCHDDVCHCAEGTCSFQKKNDVDGSHRIDKICEYGVHYAYKGTVVNITEGSHSDMYEMELVNIKSGSDIFPNGAKRLFHAHQVCRHSLDLKVGSTYLVMGFIDTNLIRNGKQLYVLDEKTWIEYYPTREECQETDGKHRATCIGMEDLINIHSRSGCPT